MEGDEWLLRRLSAEGGAIHQLVELLDQLDEQWRAKWSITAETAFIGMLDPQQPEIQDLFDKALAKAFPLALERDQGYPWRRWRHLFLRWMVIRAQRVDIYDEAGFWQALGEPFCTSSNQQKIRRFYRDHRELFTVRLARWEGSFYFVNQILLQSVCSPSLINRARQVAAQLESDPDWKRYVVDYRITRARAGLVLKEISSRVEIQDPIFSQLLDSKSGVHEHLVGIFQWLYESPAQGPAREITVFDLIPQPAVEWAYDWELQEWSEEGPLLRLPSLPPNCRWHVAGRAVQGFTWPVGVCTYDEIEASIVESGLLRRELEISLLPIIVSDQSPERLTDRELPASHCAFLFRHTNWPILLRNSEALSGPAWSGTGLRRAEIDLSEIDDFEPQFEIDGLSFKIRRNCFAPPEPSRVDKRFTPPLMQSSDWKDAVPLKQSPGFCKLQVRMRLSQQDDWRPAEAAWQTGTFLQARWLQRDEPVSEWGTEVAYLPGTRLVAPEWRFKDSEVVLEVHAPESVTIEVGPDSKHLSAGVYCVNSASDEVSIRLAKNGTVAQAQLRIPAAQWQVRKAKVQQTGYQSSFIKLEDAAIAEDTDIDLSFGQVKSAQYWLRFGPYRIPGKANAGGFSTLDSIKLRHYGFGTSDCPCVILENWRESRGIVGVASEPPNRTLPPQSTEVEILDWWPEPRPGKPLLPGPLEVNLRAVGDGFLRAVLKTLYGPAAPIRSAEFPFDLAADETDFEFLLHVPAPAKGSADEPVELYLEWRGKLDSQCRRVDPLGEVLRYQLYGHSTWLETLKTRAESLNASISEKCDYLTQWMEAQRGSVARQWQQSRPLTNQTLCSLLPLARREWELWRELTPDLTCEGACWAAGYCRACLDLLAGRSREDFAHLYAQVPTLGANPWWRLFNLIYEHLAFGSQFGKVDPGEGRAPEFMASAIQLHAFLSGIANYKDEDPYTLRATREAWVNSDSVFRAVNVLPHPLYATRNILLEMIKFLEHEPYCQPTDREQVDAVCSFLSESLRGILGKGSIELSNAVDVFHKGLSARTKIEGRAFLPRVLLGRYAEIERRADIARTCYHPRGNETDFQLFWLKKTTPTELLS